ncbi:MAG: CoA-binding protein [Luteibaculaceae bacterium]
MENLGLTVIIGASDNTTRYAYKAANMLNERGLPFKLIGLKTGRVVFGEEILPFGSTFTEPVDTITLYLGAQNQELYYDYILGLNPRRIIFNPGAENQVLQTKADENGIETEEACTLVLLSSGSYF